MPTVSAVLGQKVDQHASLTPKRAQFLSVPAKLSTPDRDLRTTPAAQWGTPYAFASFGNFCAPNTPAP